MKSKPDLATWLTSEQVQQMAGVKPRTVISWVEKKLLTPVKFQRPHTPGGAVSMFDPAAVDKLVQERAAAKTEVLPAGQPVGHPSALVRSTPQLFYPAVRDQAAPVVPIERKRYLNLAEASAYTGLGKGYIQEQLKGESKGPRRAIVYLREDLDKL